MDNEDSNDEIHSMSQRLEALAKIENISNSSSPQIAIRLASQSQQPGIESSRRIVTTTDEGRRSLISPKFDTTEEPVRNLPELNLPEKITLVIDSTKEENCTEFKLGNGSTYMPIYMIKRIVEIFVGAKSLINKNHKFAIASICSESIKWLCDFTGNVKTVITALDALADEQIDEEESSFDLGNLFEALHTQISQPKDADYVSRVIFIYSRSNCIPKFVSARTYFDLLMENDYFVLDCLYVHEPPGDENKCEDIYTELTALDVKNLSYILEVGRNATKLHDNMAKLLAHPLQRPLQRNACYKTCVPKIKEEVQTNV